MIQILLIAIILNISNQACQEGCLKCSKDDKCQICDVINFFKLENDNCVKSQLENCLLIDLSGNCLSCKDNFYIEPQLKKCIEIGLANRIQNCLTYDSKLNCSLCKEEYFIAGSQCKIQEKQIENCLYYQDIETCFECKQNFVTSIDNKTCESLTSISNCLKVSKVKCNDCQTGYIYNELAYESQWYKSSSLFEKDKLITLQINNNFKSVQKQFVCQKQQVSNCDEFVNLNTCQKCKFGHYLNSSGGCVINPIPSIQNCEVYDNKNSCKQCKQGFYRQSEISCVKVQEIANCSKYSQTDNFTKCEQCKTLFYLNGNDKCIERQKRVDNCFEYEISLDVCKTCSQSFVLTDDKLLCLSKIENCEIYKPNNFQTKELECYRCINGYHLNEDICVKGTIDNCEIYSIKSTHNQQICQKCKNQFVLQSQICVQSKKITNCSIYHTHTLNACQQCSSQNQNILLGKVCVDQPLISNCEVYSQTGTTKLECLQCSDGYFLTDKKICSEIQISNCIKLKNNKCDECKEDYFLWDERCIARPLIHKYNCQSTNYYKDHVIKKGCQICNDNHFPLDIGNSGMCFENDFIPNDKKIDNCIQYDSTDSFQCILCKEGFYIEDKNNTNQCVAQCSDTANGILRDIYSINQCQSLTGSDNCQIIARAYENTKICTQCKTGYVQVISKVYQDTLLYSMTNKKLFFNLYDNLQDKNFQVSCVKESTVPSASLTTNCLYYQYLDTTYKCIRCIDYYTGTFSANDKIQSCTRDNKFLEKKIYNFDNVYGIIQSGYQCQDNLEIPWLNIRNEASKGLCSVDITNLQIDYSNNIQIRSNFCANPNIIDSSFAIPQNCGTILTKSILSDAKCKLKSIECLYCKPKFKPTYTTNKITQCTFVDYCIGDQWFNGCSQCENGFSYKFVNGNVKYDECIENSDIHCFVQDTDTNQCKICKYGYTLIKGKCELITPQKCKLQTSFSFNSNSDFFKSDKIEYSNALKFNIKYLYNCYDCQQGYTSIKTSSYNFCIASEKLTSLYKSEGFDNNDYYIQNCEQYQNLTTNGTDIKHTCLKCGKDLFAFEDECIKPLTHCEVVKKNNANEKVCDKCKQGYGLQNDNCVVSQVDNCLENQTFDTCKTCEKTYYLKTGKCQKSQVQNCDTVTDLHKCSLCKEGYLLYETTDKDYCFPRPNGLECKQGKIFQDVEFGAEIICEKCPKVNQLLLSDIQANFEFKSVCANILLIEHCIKYNENKIFNIENFNCIECASDYYLDDNQCKQRQVKTENCIKYDLKKDDCLQCKEGYYKQESQCIINPFGIQGCVIYESANSCKQCEANKFSQDGLCYSVKSTDRIENCEIYQTGTLCQSCQSGYYLNNNICVRTQLQNCLEYESPTICKKCADQYTLKEEDTKTICQKVEKQRCLEVDMTKENKPCKKCEFQFYINEITGNCDEVPKENRIDSCLSYINNKQCDKCSLGYVLTKDKLLCSKNPLLVNQIPDNCQNAQEQELFCSICQGGYIVQNGQCSLCNENNFDSGCYYCLSNYEGCFICRSGYYMNKDQKCNKFIANNNNNEVDDLSNKSVLILKFIKMFLAIFLI